MSRRTSMVPLPAAGGGGVGARVISILVGLTLFALLLRDPVGAAGTVELVARWISDALDALGRFGAALSS